MSPAPIRGCGDWRASRRAFLGRASEVVPVPADALDGLQAFARQGGLTRRNLLERGVGLWIAASAHRRPLHARGARGRRRPGATGARRHDPRLALPRRGQRRPQHARPARRPPLPSPAHAPRASRRHDPPGHRVARVRLAPLARRAEGPVRRGQGGRAAVGGLRRRRPVPLQLRRLLAPRHRGALVRERPAGWAGPSTRSAAPTTRCRGSASPIRPTRSCSRSARPTATVYDPSNFDFYIEGVWRDEGFVRAYRDAATGRTASPALAAARRTYLNAFRVRDQLAAAEGGRRPPAAAGADGVPRHRPRHGAAGTWRACWAPASARASPRCRSAGSTPTTSSSTTHAELLTDLCDSLCAWQADLEARGLSSRVLTLVWSEFGRRPEDNDSPRHRPRRRRAW